MPRQSQKKIRADELVFRLGLAENRTRAKALIMARAVRWGDRVIEKAGEMIAVDTMLTLADRSVLKYVSRGGLKLEGALKTLGCRVEGLIALDVGASTGGFTDCLLAHGASMVYAVDVGKNLMHERVRRDERVRVIEEVNARYLTPALFDQRPLLAVIDVSFISLTKVLPAVVACLDSKAKLLCLVKPQFELERGRVPGGIVRQESDRQEALERIREFSIKNLKCEVLGVCQSAVAGRDGNIEFFIYLSLS